MTFQEAESDDDITSDSDGELPVVEDVQDVEPDSPNVGDPEDEPNSTAVAEDSAVRRAAEIYECQDAPTKTCHCHCVMWDGKPCIQQFDVTEQEEIR